jgi:hypothetical protein
LLHTISGLLESPVSGDRIERKPAISSAVQAKFLDLVPGLHVNFTHGNILENANGHICSLQHTTGILIVPPRTGATMCKSGKELRQCQPKCIIAHLRPVKCPPA